MQALACLRPFVLVLLLAPAAYGQGLPGQAQPPAPPDEEPVTEEQILELRQDGLIARQAEISEGLLLMDRQLRQAQMAQQLLAIYGHDIPVEITPGVFRDFSETTLGMQEEVARLKLELDRLNAASELRAAQSANRADSLVGTLLTVGSLVAVAGRAEDDPGYAMTVRELQGGPGGYAALLRIEGEDLLVAPGDLLEDFDVEVVAVQPGQVVLRRPGGRLSSLPVPN